MVGRYFDPDFLLLGVTNFFEGALFHTPWLIFVKKSREGAFVLRIFRRDRDNWTKIELFPVLKRT